MRWSLRSRPTPEAAIHPVMFDRAALRQNAARSGRSSAACEARAHLSKDGQELRPGERPHSLGRVLTTAWRSPRDYSFFVRSSGCARLPRPKLSRSSTTALFRLTLLRARMWRKEVTYRAFAMTNLSGTWSSSSERPTTTTVKSMQRRCKGSARPARSDSSSRAAFAATVETGLSTVGRIQFQESIGGSYRRSA